MSKQHPNDAVLIRLVRIATNLVAGVMLFIIAGGLGYWGYSHGRFHTATTEPHQTTEKAVDTIEDGIDVMSGLIAEGDYLIVRAACTACHSGKLVTQNRATAEGWTQMIRWMQDTQGLWDLGEQESIIINYLATYYAPQAQGRRAPLAIETWYELEN